jgi:flagellar export protein FliJ
VSRPFRFEPLLEVARQREEQHLRTLAALIDAQETASAYLAHLLAIREAQLDAISTTTADGRLDPARYAESVAYLDRLGDEIATQREVLAAATSEVEQARAVLVSALQERRSLEILEEHDAADAAQEAGRQEDARTDDLNTQRYIRRAQEGVR